VGGGGRKNICGAGETDNNVMKIPVEKIIGNYKLGRIEKIEPLKTSGNFSFILTSKENKYILRLSPSGPRSRSRDEIAAEIELLRYLKSKSFPALAPVKDGGGNEILSWKNHFGYLRAFCGATAKLSPTVAEVKKFGEVLGRFHRLIQGYQTKEKRTHVFDAPATKRLFLKKKTAILASDFKNKKAFIDKFEKEINSLVFPNTLPRGMIHEDLGRRHVLWSKNKIMAIVDFDRTYYGHLILDLGQACRGWCFVNDWNKWSDENFRALISGYEKKRRLTDLERRCLFDAIKFGVLERSLSFCLRYLYVNRNKADQNFALDGLFNQLKLLQAHRREIESSGV